MTSTHVDQVGGKHYQSTTEGQQHWDLVERFDLDYLLGNATKYLARARKKGNMGEDLRKAASYVAKAIACRPGKGALRLATEADVDTFLAANSIHWMDGEVIKMLVCSGSHQDLVDAHARILGMAEGL